MKVESSNTIGQLNSKVHNHCSDLSVVLPNINQEIVPYERMCACMHMHTESNFKEHMCKREFKFVLLN